MTSHWLWNPIMLRRARGSEGRRASLLCWFEYFSTGVVQMLLTFVLTVMMFPLAGAVLAVFSPGESLLRDYGPLGLFCAFLMTAVVALAKYVRYLITRQMTVIDNNTKAFTAWTEVMRNAMKRGFCVYQEMGKESNHGQDDGQD